MKEGSGMSSTLPILSLNQFNTSKRIGISQSSFDNFNKAMNNLNEIDQKYVNTRENQNNKSQFQIKEQIRSSDNSKDNIIFNIKKKQKKTTLNMINIQSKALMEYKDVPPRRPRYIRCLNNPILSNPHKNLSKSLPIQRNDDKLFFKSTISSSQSNNVEFIKTNQNLVQFGDPSNCYSSLAIHPRTPALSLRMKIKAAKEAESNMINDQQLQIKNIDQRAKTTFTCSREINQINPDVSNNENARSITELKSASFKKPENKNVQCMALKYFGESGKIIGCFSAKIPVRFPVDEKAKIKRALQNLNANPQSNPPSSSPSNQSNAHFNNFLTIVGQ